MIDKGKKLINPLGPFIPSLHALWADRVSGRSELRVQDVQHPR